MPLDIAIGALLAYGVHATLDVPLTPVLLVVGIASALLPDIDIVTALFGRWRHREVTHYPLLYVPLLLGAFLYAPLAYALLFSLGVLAHFVHDTIGTGWGISWFWPFTERRYLLFPYKRREQMGVFASWLPRERPEWRHHGSHQWLAATYFRLSPVAVLEYGVLLAVVLAALFYIW